MSAPPTTLNMLVTTGPIMQMSANRPITGKNQPRMMYAMMIQ